MTTTTAIDAPKRTPKLIGARRGVCEIDDILYLHFRRAAALRGPVDLDMTP